MKLEQLQFFAQAVKYRSISVAAEKSHISQPAFSGQISKLEKELNIKLLNRTTKGVTPTAAGVEILAKIDTVLDNINEINNIAYNYNSRGGVVKLATIPCMCDKIIPIVAKTMRENHPSSHLAITCQESSEVYHSVLSGTAALGILFNSVELTSLEIIYTPLFEDEYVLYVGPKSPYWDAESITIKEAMAQPYIAYRNEFIKDYGGVSAVFKDMMPNIALRTDELESVKKIISEDNYVAFYHRIMTREDVYLKYNLLRAIPISDYDTRTQVGYIESKKYKPSALDKVFIKVLKQIVSETFCQNCADC